MPMAGRGSRFADSGFETPKPLVAINEKPFFYWAIRSIAQYTDISELIAVVLKEHVDNFQIDERIKSYFTECKIVVLPGVTDGAVITCQKALQLVDNDCPIIFNDCDHLFKCAPLYDLCNSKSIPQIDGALLTFKSNEPRFSFAEFDINGKFIRTVEKQAVSSHAICGAYYFKNKSIFEKNAAEYLKICKYSEYFVSGIYNVLAENGGNVKLFEVDYHLPFGTPEEYEAAKDSLRFLDLL
jgi:dTDP-glucose pyrophosphorylase